MLSSKNIKNRIKLSGFPLDISFPIQFFSLTLWAPDQSRFTHLDAHIVVAGAVGRGGRQDGGGRGGRLGGVVRVGGAQELSSGWLGHGGRLLQAAPVPEHQVRLKNNNLCQREPASR